MLKWLIISQLCAKPQTLFIPYKIIGVYSTEYTGSICDQNMTDSPFTRNLHIKKILTSSYLTEHVYLVLPH